MYLTVETLINKCFVDFIMGNTIPYIIVGGSCTLPRSHFHVKSSRKKCLTFAPATIAPAVNPNVERNPNPNPNLKDIV